MKKLLKNGLVFIDGEFKKQDILINDKKIEKVDTNIDNDNYEVFDLTGKHIFPGLIDLHSHLRDPGQTYKEDIVTGTKAAAKGGYTMICAMPNTEPVVDNIATVEYIKEKPTIWDTVKVGVIGALTKGLEGIEIAEIAGMLEGGIVAVSDDGHCVQNAKIKLNSMKYVANFDIPVIVHPEDYNLAGKGQINSGKMSTTLGLSGIPAMAEEIIISRDIMLAESAKCRLHIAHISTKKAVQLVKDAKKRGITITSEVTPHHLTLTEEACINFDTNTRCKPPLRTEADRLACLEGLKDGTIDFIATDHAPHADYEKEREFNLAPFGINGFETAFSSLYNDLVIPGHLSLEMLVEKLTKAPAEFLRLETGSIKEGFAADFAIADLSKDFEVKPENLASKSKNTPYVNKTLKSKIVMTICDGKITWSEI